MPPMAEEENSTSGTPDDGHHLTQTRDMTTAPANTDATDGSNAASAVSRSEGERRTIAFSLPSVDEKTQSMTKKSIYNKRHVDWGELRKQKDEAKKREAEKTAPLDSSTSTTQPRPDSAERKPQQFTGFKSSSSSSYTYGGGGGGGCSSGW